MQIIISKTILFVRCNMKKFEKYICILFVVTGFITAYIVGYKIGNKDDEKIVKNENVSSDIPYVNNILNNSTTDVSNSESVVKDDAKLVIEICKEEEKDKITTETRDVPVEMIGLTRSDVIEYLEDSREYFDKKGEEIDSLLLVSFSPEQVVIRKNTHEVEIVVYSNEQSERYNYYIAFKQDKVMVYKKDKETVFIETGITYDMLDIDTRESIEKGVWIENISVLYRYLESITS